MSKVVRTSWLGRLVLFVWLLSSITAFAFVHIFGLPIPYADEWANVSHALGEETVSFSWLQSLHNEHRFPLFRLIYVSLTRITSNNFRSGMFFNVFALSGLGLAMLVGIRKIRGNISITDIFFPICLLNLGHYENLLSGNQIQFILVTVFLSVILLLIALNRVARFSKLLTIATLTFLLPGAGLAGLIVALPILAWLFAVVIILFQSGRLSRGQLALLCIPLVAAATASIFYFVDYDPVFFYLSYTPSDVARGSLEFLSTSFGPVDPKTGLGIAIFCIALFGASVWILATQTKEREEHFRLSGMSSILVGSVLLTLAIGFGRSGAGPGAAAAHRYATLAAIFPCFVYIVFILYGRGKARYGIPVLLLAATLAALPTNTNTAMQFATSRHAGYQKFSRDIEANLPVDAVALRNLEVIFPFFTPEISNGVRLLQDHKIGPFRNRKEPLPEIPLVREVAIPLTVPTGESSAPRDFRFSFDPPRYLLGFKPGFIIQNSDRQPQLFLSWRPAQTNAIRNVRFPLGSSPQEQTYSFWIYESVNEIRLSAPQDDFRLKTMTLLMEKDSR